MKTRVALAAILTLYAGTASAAIGRAEAERRAGELSQASERVYHLIGVCMAGGAQSCARNAADIDRGIALLESNSLSAGSAAKYRQARIKIDEGGRDYEQARRSAGRERSRWVELGNAAMEIARTLLRGAVEMFNGVFPRIVAGEGWGQGYDRRGPDTEKHPGRQEGETLEEYCLRMLAKDRQECQRKSQNREDRIQRQWQKDVARCSQLIDYWRDEGMTQAEIDRAYNECRQKANDDLQRRLRESRALLQKCLNEAKEKYWDCLNSENDG